MGKRKERERECEGEKFQFLFNYRRSKLFFSAFVSPQCCCCGCVCCSAGPRKAVCSIQRCHDQSAGKVF